jgi:3-oxoadipate enol-lactonase
MPYVDTGELKLYYEESGAGTPVVFLHGYTLDRRMWRRQVEYFSKNHRIIVNDSRGHGLSDAPDTGYNRVNRLRDLKCLAQSLQLGKFHIVGLSMGGGVALAYAIEHPDDLLSLTLVDSGAAGYPPPPGYRKLPKVTSPADVASARTQWIESALSYYKNENLRRELAEVMTGHSDKVWLDPLRGKYPVFDDINGSKSVKIPTLIFVGGKDRYFIPLAKTLHQNIEGSELDIVPDVGHMLNMEAPERFNQRLAQFLDRVDQNH